MLQVVFVVLLVTFIIIPQECECLRNVTLIIEPRVVQRHHHSILHCNYDLEDGVLYTVKWYRGMHEFYRYTPKEHPTTKVFPFAGITVDVNNSNSTQSFLRNIEFNLAGNFSCEVTTEGEPFPRTAFDTQEMIVVQLPENPPKISVTHEPLDPGDILRANCSSPKSKPVAILKFVINNITVARSELLPSRKTQEPAWSDLSLELPLSEFHFRGGRLILTCEAQVADIYQQNGTVQLLRARDPVPERVSAMGLSNSFSTSGSAQFIICLLLYFITN